MTVAEFEAFVDRIPSLKMMTISPSLEACRVRCAAALAFVPQRLTTEAMGPLFAIVVRFCLAAPLGVFIARRHVMGIARAFPGGFRANASGGAGCASHIGTNRLLIINVHSLKGGRGSGCLEDGTSLITFEIPG